MKYPYDLHVHSAYSGDAELLPETIFEKAKQLNLKGVVITDHNAVRSIDLVKDIAAKFGLFTCQGIEISAKYLKIDVHILGYSLNFKKDVLLSGLKKTLSGYNERSKTIVDKINQLKIAKISFDKLAKEFPDFYLPKPRIAEEVAYQNKIPFKKALALMERGGPTYTPYGEWAMSPEDAVKLIKKANGIPILAHPGDFEKRSSFSPQKTEKILFRLIDSLVKIGLLGLEAIYSKHTSSQNRRFRLLAKNKNLLITGGTDWHGEKLTPEFEIGDFGITSKDFMIFKKTIEKIK